MAREEQVLEYICIHCWKGFHSEDAHKGSGGALVCPHCHATQPTVDELLSPDFDANAAPPSARRSTGGGAKREEDTDIPENVVPLPRPMPAEPSAPASEEERSPEDVLRETILSMDPNNAAWRLRSSIGITYNFPGWDAMLRWVSGRSGANGMAVSVLGLDVWKDFDDMRAQLRDTPDSRMAFLLAQPFHSTQGTASVAPLSGASLASALAAVPRGGGAPKATDGRLGSKANAERDRQQARPAPTSATYRLPALPASSHQVRFAALFFGLGFLTGAATLFVLWYLRVLDGLPFGR